MTQSVTPQFYLHVRSEGPAIFAGVNDAPVVSDPDGQGVVTYRPVNEWILADRNRLTISMSWPNAKEFVRGQTRVEVSLFVANPEFEYPEPGIVLAQFNWPLPGVPEAYPFRFDPPVKIHQTPPPTTLSSRTQLIESITDPDRFEILRLVEAFREALLGNDPNAAFAFVQERYADEAIAYGKPVERNRAVVLKQYGELMSEPDRKSEPLKPASAVYDIVAGGRLVLINRAPAAPAIVISANDGKVEYSIDVYAGKVDGKWRVLR